MPDTSVQLSDDIFAELRKIDTPTITNVVATYPKNPLCLGLYNPWTENWYSDSTIRCLYPEMGPIVGYAVTCVYGLPDPNFAGRLSFMDVAPGDLIHMDENGAVKFPVEHAPAIVKNARAMLDDEAHRLVLLRKARTAAEVRAASSGGAYTPKKG